MSEICETCGGTGEVEIEDIYGYVTLDMATDACESMMEGMPLYHWVKVLCPDCEGNPQIPTPDPICRGCGLIFPDCDCILPF